MCNTFFSQEKHSTEAFRLKNCSILNLPLIVLLMVDLKCYDFVETARYKKTCDEYYQAGANVSGVMLVDLDGPGDLDPVHVRCHMG